MPKHRWDPSTWVSLVPNGIGHTKPNHYLEIAKTIWRNRQQLPFAWRILSRGVCDGCALGTSGLHDFTIDGVHLCTVRLELLHLNTMPAIDIRKLHDAANLDGLSSAQLRELGRLPYPMVRRKGDSGFTRVNWDQAISLIASRIRATDPKRVAFYLTSRGLTNESYYVAQKAARFIGTNNIDNSSRICHSASTAGMKQSLGVAASTCSYRDWIGTDLLVLFGSNTPNNQPVTTKYIYLAKKEGTRVVVINPYREPGLERYWVPSTAESALFGTRMADHFFQVHTGGDRAFIAGTIKHMIDNGWIDDQFVARYTNGFDDLRSTVSGYTWELLEAQSGATRDSMLDFARMLGQAKTAVFIWSMGITQHRHGTANVKAIVDLALTRGFVGREKCGLMPIRGHSGVQGGAEVGAAPNLFPGGVAVGPEGASRFSKFWGFDVPEWPGLNAVQMIDAAHQSGLDVFYQVGGNFLETLPDPDYVRQAVARIPVRVHQDIILNPQMLVDPADLVVLLPARTRYEQPGGGTETTTERRILFSPEIPGRRIGESRAEWEIFTALARAIKPEACQLFQFEDAAAIRLEIAAAVPAYNGIQNLAKPGDQIQWGGARLCEQTGPDGRSSYAFPAPEGRARFSPIEIDGDQGSQGLLDSKLGLTDHHRADDPLRTPTGSPIDSTEQGPPLRTPAGSPLDSTELGPPLRTPAGSPRDRRTDFVLRLSTRRGKQFNSMIQRDRDPLTGARRDDVLMNTEDAASLGVADGDVLLLKSDAGEIRGRCRIAPIARGNIQAHWPEANPLIARGSCDPDCGIPDYNTLVHITALPAEPALRH
jgi:molybdopterin-dependent oxidoreductase alpha subunit